MDLPKKSPSWDGSGASPPAEAIAAALGRTVSAAIRTKAAQKRMALHNDAPRQGPPRLRLPWEQAPGPPDMSASAHETGKGKWW